VDVFFLKHGVQRICPVALCIATYQLKDQFTFSTGVCHWYICRHAAMSSALHYARTRCSEVHFSPHRILPRFRFPTFPAPRILHVSSS